MGREVRRVPANWEHPKTARESMRGVEVRYKPMHDRSFDVEYEDWQVSLKEWYEDQKFWEKGIYNRRWDKTQLPVKQLLAEWKQDIEEKRNYPGSTYREEEWQKLTSSEVIVQYSDYAGEPPSPPNPEDYMPKGEWYQLFEDVSEGTPLSPPFATSQELIDWLVANPDYWGSQWNREGAESLIKDGGTVSLVMSGGKFYEPEEQYKLNKKDVA